MPLTEREKEELARKIDQQRKAMWKGQPTSERQTKTEQSPEKSEETSKPKQEPEIAKQTPKSDYHAVESEIVDRPDETKPTLKEQSQDEKEELAKKIKQQRRAVWKGKPEPRSKRPKSARSVDRALYNQKKPELAEHPAIDHSEQQETQETEEESKEYQSKAPPLKLALIVIIGLIGAIALGIAIGYIAVVRDLINV